MAVKSRPNNEEARQRFLEDQGVQYTRGPNGGWVPVKQGNTRSSNT